MCLETKQIHNTKSQFFQMSAKIMTCSLSPPPPKKNTDNLIINIEIKTGIKNSFCFVPYFKSNLNQNVTTSDCYVFILLCNKNVIMLFLS